LVIGGTVFVIFFLVMGFIERKFEPPVLQIGSMVYLWLGCVWLGGLIYFLLKPGCDLV
jgi:multisubunit Na+/H+ antiporter MnhB subunit